MNKQMYLVEGALLIALYNVILFLSLILPFVGMVLVFVLPVPFIIYTYKYGLQKAVLFLFAALFVSFLINTLPGVIFTSIFGVAGIVMGFFAQKQKSGIETLIAGTLAFVFPLLLLYIASITLFGMNLETLIEESTTETLNMVEGILKMSGAETELLIEQMEQAIEVFSFLLPSTLLLTAFTLALFSQLVGYPILRRLKIGLNKVPSFREVLLPKSFLWFYLIILLLSMIQIEPGTFFYMAIINIFYILQLLMVLQGLSLIYFFCHKKGIPLIVPIILTVLSPFLLYIIRILGIIDLGFDLRNRIKTKR